MGPMERPPEGLRPQCDMGKADLHVHSAAGDGLASVGDILEYVEHRTDLDVIAITDHDDLRGAFKGRELAAARSYRFDFVVGVEITTLHGHLLAYGIEKPIKGFRSLAYTIDAVHGQGGLCVIPHPMSWLTRSVGRRRLLAMARSSFWADGIELMNPSVAGRVAFQRAIDLNREVLGLPEVAGSDSHSLSLIGSAYTTFLGHTEADLWRSLSEGSTRACGEFWTFRDHYEIAGRQTLRSMVISPSEKVGRAIGRFVRREKE